MARTPLTQIKVTVRSARDPRGCYPTTAARAAVRYGTSSFGFGPISRMGRWIEGGPISRMRAIAGRVRTGRTWRVDPLERPIFERLAIHRLGWALTAIEGRRLPTPAGWGESYSPMMTDQAVTPTSLLALIHGEGWHEYSSRAGSWRTAASYLCGRDRTRGAAWWAVRVPSTVTTCLEALDWLTPAEVHRAREAGCQVIRQGDVYLVAVRADRGASTDLGALRGTRHAVRSHRRGGHTVVHPEHGSVHLSCRWSWVAYVQRQMGAGGRRVDAD